VAEKLINQSSYGALSRNFWKGQFSHGKFLYFVLFFTPTKVHNVVGHCMGNLWWGGDW